MARTRGAAQDLFTLSYVEPVGSTFVQVTPGTIASFCIDLNEFIYPSAPAGPNHYEIISLARVPQLCVRAGSNGYR